MKKLLIICFIIVGIIFVAGCIGDNKIESQSVNPVNPDLTEINRGSDQDSLAKIGKYIDPKLKNIKIESNDPDIEIIKLWLESNTNSPSILLLLQNNGNKPARIYAEYTNPNIKFPENGISTGDFSKLINSKERIFFNLEFSREDPRGPLGYEYPLSEINIYAYKTVVPDISKEIKDIPLDLTLFDMEGSNSKTERTKRSNYLKQAMDVYSIKYTVENNEKYVIFGLRASEYNTNYEDIVVVRGVDGEIGRQEPFISSDKIDYIKIPLGVNDQRFLREFTIFSK